MECEVLIVKDKHLYINKQLELINKEIGHNDERHEREKEKYHKEMEAIDNVLRHGTSVCITYNPYPVYTLNRTLH